MLATVASWCRLNTWTCRGYSVERQCTHLAEGRTYFSFPWISAAYVTPTLWQKCPCNSSRPRLESWELAVLVPLFWGCCIFLLPPPARSPHSLDKLVQQRASHQAPGPTARLQCAMLYVPAQVNLPATIMPESSSGTRTALLNSRWKTTTVIVFWRACWVVCYPASDNCYD